MRTKSSKKSGISLIVLVITIIVIIILAVAVILSIANNNPIENANKAKFQNDLKSIQEELELVKSSNYVENKGASYNNKDGSEITITNLSSAQKYNTKLRVDNGVLYYNDGLSAKEKEWAEEVGITDGAYVVGTTEDGTVLDGTVLSGQYTGTAENVKVAEGVTKISGTAISNPLFGGESGVKSVTLPSTLTIIGDYSFYRNSNITNLKIPDSVTSIGQNAFQYCSNLELEVGKSFSSAGLSSFDGVKSVTFTNTEMFKNITVQQFFAHYLNVGIQNVENLVIKGTNLTRNMIDEATEIGYNPTYKTEVLDKIDEGKIVLLP